MSPGGGQVVALLQNEDANKQDKHGNTPMHIACQNGHMEVSVQPGGGALTRSGGAGTGDTDAAPLPLQIIKVLIQHKANVNARNVSGRGGQRVPGGARAGGADGARLSVRAPAIRLCTSPSGTSTWSAGISCARTARTTA